jgi:hypothetical protein
VQTKQIVIAAILISAIVGIAIATTVSSSLMTTDAKKGKGHSDFGQCNKKANEANRAANITGKAASDARKAACAALHP